MRTETKYKINLPLVNMLLYAALLVATPFIMLQNYLQGFMRNLSSASIHILNSDIAIIPVLFVLFLIVFAIVFRKIITRKLLSVIGIILLLIGLGQWISDYYINYKIYDLQNNWHYFAYCLFAVIIYVFLKSKSIALNRIHFFVFVLAAAISIFDELFQNLLSQRIFDFSDVAKDLWGVSMGLIVVNFLIENRKLNWAVFKIRKDKIDEYFKNEDAGLFLVLLFSFCFLLISSLLTDNKYGFSVLVVSLFLCLFVCLIIHIWKGRTKKIVQIIFGLLIIAQVVSISLNYKKDFIFHNNFLTIYKGIPLMYFDVIFYPNQTFRMADKKTEFNKTDKETLMKYNPDILLIGAGQNGEGGNGFPHKNKSHFIFNPASGKAVQVMIFDSRQACIKYNELLENGKRVLFVLHKSSRP